MTHPSHLHARPSAMGRGGVQGLHRVSTRNGRHSLIYVPQSVTAENATPLPLVVLLHGAGGNAESGLALLQALAEEQHILLLAPASAEQTWDVILRRRFDADIALIDQLLDYVFARHAVDPHRVGVAGFSDGASYALALGLANGTLFSHTMAFSPGYVPPFSPRGNTAVFISHGTQDTVLPVARCSRTIVPHLQQAGYRVTYVEFDGGHIVPDDIADRAIGWFMQEA